MKSYSYDNHTRDAVPFFEMHDDEGGDALTPSRRGSRDCFVIGGAIAAVCGVLV